MDVATVVCFIAIPTSLMVGILISRRYSLDRVNDTITALALGEVARSVLVLE